MQSFAAQTTAQSENSDGNSKATLCQPTSTPAKTKHVETSHGSTGPSKPTFVLVKENGVLKAKQVLKVVKVVKPQVPACIKACDVSSLLDQFLEYEQNQSSSVMIVKGSSVALTPVSSPSHTPRFPGQDTGKKQTTISSNGLTPPVSPPSESKVTLPPTKTINFTVTPTKNPPLEGIKSASVGMVTNLPVTPSKNITPKIVSPSVDKTANLTVTPTKTTIPTIASLSPSVNKTGNQPERPSEEAAQLVEKACDMEIDEEISVGKILVNNSNNDEFSTENKNKKDIKIEPTEIKELPRCSSHQNSSIEEKVKDTVPKEMSTHDGLVKPNPSEQVKPQNYKIPKKKPDEVERKRRFDSETKDDKCKDDYYDFKRSKYTRDECYWTTSDEENDDNRGRYHRSKRRNQSNHIRRHHRDSSSDSDDDSRNRRSYSRQKYERQHDNKSKQRSRSPHQKHKYDSDEDRHRKSQRQHREKPENKSPLKEDSEESNVHLFDIENERKKNFKLDRIIKETSNEKRKIVYVGNIESSTTKSDIWSKFRKFGPIEKTTVHYRNDGDNYSFVTFVDPSSALEAIEEGKTDPDLKHLDICFGGRRKFCGGSYVDFDSTTSCFEEQQEKEGIRKASHSTEAMDFDTLLQMALKKKR